MEFTSANTLNKADDIMQTIAKRSQYVAWGEDFQAETVA